MVTLIVFDVDGTLVSTKSGEPFRKTADDWQWMPNRLEVCKKLRAQGIFFAIASNQAGVAFPWSRFSEASIQSALQKVGNEIDVTYIAACCSTPNVKALPEYYNENDPRRKPNPGMLLEAIEWHDVEKEYTLMVGDREEDEQAAKNAGIAFMWAEEFFSDKPIII